MSRIDQVVNAARSTGRPITCATHTLFEADPATNEMVCIECWMPREPRPPMPKTPDGEPVALVGQRAMPIDNSTFEVHERLLLTADDRLVPEGDPAGRWLYAIPGAQIRMADAIRYGLVAPTGDELPAA